jgi:hypothetical protein
MKSSMKCFVFLFDETNELAKIVRLQVMVVADEVMQTDSRLQIDVKRWAGLRICCKSSDYRVAEFVNFTEPGVVKDVAMATAVSLSPGIAQLTVWSLSQTCVAATVLLRVGESNWGEGNRKCLGRTELRLKVGESAKRAVNYKNTKGQRKTIRVTTSHPQLVTFDPTHYDIEPEGTGKIRVVFMANTKVEEVFIYVFVHETTSSTGPNEFYKFQVFYQE